MFLRQWKRKMWKLYAIWLEEIHYILPWNVCSSFILLEIIWSKIMFRAASKAGHLNQAIFAMSQSKPCMSSSNIHTHTYIHTYYALTNWMNIKYSTIFTPVGTQISLFTRYTVNTYVELIHTFAWMRYKKKITESCLKHISIHTVEMQQA